MFMKNTLLSRIRKHLLRYKILDSAPCGFWGTAVLVILYVWVFFPEKERNIEKKSSRPNSNYGTEEKVQFQQNSFTVFEDPREHSHQKEIPNFNCWNKWVNGIRDKWFSLFTCQWFCSLIRESMHWPMVNPIVSMQINYVLTCLQAVRMNNK